MKKNLLIYVLLLLLIAPLAAAQKVKEKDLPARFREFLNFTRYIILDQERDVFLKLTSDRDRDIFITAFWKQRDPTPGTPENENKIEHQKRVGYANRVLGRSATRPGWMTDQGRIHIILGEPSSKERFNATIGVYPVEVWYYYGDSSRGLPPHFAIVFFKRSGMGEFKLYDHVADGPTTLLVEGRQMDSFDYEAVYDRIYELAPTLALVSHSMIPGDIPFNFQPSPINNILMASVFDAPKKDVNPTYATHFLDYKGIVSTEYMTNMIASDSHVDLLRDPLTDIDFIHYIIAPKTVSIDYYEPKDQYYCNFTINASMRTDDENIIFQYTKDFPFYFNPDDLDRIRGNGIAIEDSFPVVAGTYKFVVLLQNSVGKEFSLLEETLIIPPRTGVCRIPAIYMGYKQQAYNNNIHIPFKLLDRKLVVDPTNTFGMQDQVSFFLNLADVTPAIWEQGQIRVNIKGLKPNDPSQKSFVMQLKDQPFRRVLTLMHTFPAQDLVPDYYVLKAELYDETGAKFDERTVNFIISPENIVAHPIVHARAFSLANSFLYYSVLAHQYEKVNDLDSAEQSYARVHEMKPDYKRGLVDYANLLYKKEKFDDILTLIEKISSNEEMRFEYYLLKGKAYMGMKNYTDAIDNFLQGNEIYNSDISLLNAIGYCYFKTGEKQKALDALNASLKLNSGQENVKQLILEIGK